MIPRIRTFWPNQPLFSSVTLPVALPFLQCLMTFGTIPSQEVFLSWLKIWNPQVLSIVWQYFHLDSSSTELSWPWNIECTLTFRQKPYDYTMLKELDIFAELRVFLQHIVGNSKYVTNETLFTNIYLLQNCVGQPRHITWDPAARNQDFQNISYH